MIYLNQHQIRGLMGDLSDWQKRIDGIDGLTSTGDIVDGNISITGTLIIKSGILVSGQPFSVNLPTGGNGYVDVWGSQTQIAAPQGSYLRINNSGQEPVVGILSGKYASIISLDSGNFITQSGNLALSTVGTFYINNKGSTVLQTSSNGVITTNPPFFNNVRTKLIYSTVASGETKLIDEMDSTSYNGAQYLLSLSQDNNVQVRKIWLLRDSGVRKIEENATAYSGNADLATLAVFSIVDNNPYIKLYLQNSAAGNLRVWGTVREIV